MTIFTTSFKDSIQDELTRRSEFDYTQDYLAPFTRVTALIESDNLMGFTLGIPDNSIAQDISTVFSTPSSIGNNVVGITYKNGSSLVRIDNPAGANIPTPGVTGVDISSLYRGGFVLDTTVSFKFYTKAQYDYLYQTFFRPGTLVLIEYGHTSHKANSGALNLTHPNIFRQLTADFYSGKRTYDFINSTPVRDYIVGIIVNYDVKLNDSNEYEAEIKLTNAGEFAYSMGLKNTLIYLNQQVSRVTRTVGLGTDTIGETTNPEQILPAISGISIHNLFGNSDANFKDDQIYNLVKIDAESDTLKIDKDNTKDHIYVSTDSDTSGYDFYMSLYYVIGKLIPNILNEFEIRMPVNSNLRPMLHNIAIDLRQERNTEVKYFSELRSIDRNVIINNNAIYDSGSLKNRKTNHFENIRLRAYQTKYDTDENGKLFDLVDTTIATGTHDKPTYDYQTFTGFYGKKKYAPDEEVLADLKGIYISYLKFREIFLDSITLVDAINKILGMVSTSTYNMIKLKIRYVDGKDHITGDTRSHLIIYDESALDTTKVSDPYTFNKRIDSETMAVEFDFGLSQAAAASIASGYVSSDPILGGAVKERILIDYGLDPNIQNISSNVISQGESILDVANTGVLSLQNNRSEDEEEEEPFNVSSMGHFSTQIGLFELMPDEMFAKAIDNDKMYKTLPSAATIGLTIQGISGFRYGDMFKVQDILPGPYEEKGLFFLTGHKHSITPTSWTTTIQGQYLGSAV